MGCVLTRYGLSFESRVSNLIWCRGTERCVCVRVRVRARACVRVRVRARACACVRVRALSTVRIVPEPNPLVSGLSSWGRDRTYAP